MGTGAGARALRAATRHWLPRRGRISDFGHAIEGSHFAERCQGFIIIALGESIVVTGASAAQAGLRAEAVAALSVAFLETSALWWLYFSEVAVNSPRLSICSVSCSSAAG